jgi:hypothetical protein
MPSKKALGHIQVLLVHLLAGPNGKFLPSHHKIKNITSKYPMYDWWKYTFPKLDRAPLARVVATIGCLIHLVDSVCRHRSRLALAPCHKFRVKRPCSSRYLVNSVHLSFTDTVMPYTSTNLGNFPSTMKRELREFVECPCTSPM